MNKKFVLEDGTITMVHPGKDIEIDFPDTTGKTVEEYKEELKKKRDELLSQYQTITRNIAECKESHSGSCSRPAAIAFEYHCGDCCKKATGYGDVIGLFFEIQGDFIKGTLLNLGGTILVEVFNNGRLIDQEIIQDRLDVYGDSFCTAEINIIQLDTDSPTTGGISPLAYELECGSCCKKITNVAYETRFTDAQLLLEPYCGEKIIVKTYSAGKVIERQCIDRIYVLIDKVCSREFNVLSN